MTPTTGRRVGTLIGVTLAVASLTFLLRRATSDWDAVGPLLSGASWGPILAATGSILVAMVGLALTWGALIAALGAPWPGRLVVAWYFLGEAGKYLPGGVWPLLGRGELARRGGVDTPIAVMSVVGSLAIICVSASVVAVLVAPWGLSMSGAPERIAVLSVAPVGLMLLHPRVTTAVSAAIGRASRGRVGIPAMAWGTAVRLVLAGCPTWALLGVAHVLVARSLHLHVNPSRVVFASIVAWVGGILAVGAPAGLGVREAIFVSLSGIGGAPAVAVTAVARLCCVAVDGLGALAAAGVVTRQAVAGGGGPNP